MNFPRNKESKDLDSSTIQPEYLRRVHDALGQRPGYFDPEQYISIEQVEQVLLALETVAFQY